MTAYVGIDGKARKIGAAYIGVDGVARKVKKAYVGVDGVAQLWWTSEADPKTAVLEVAKKTTSTYAGGTTYNDEHLVLIDVYPKKNGTVKVTYGGLTKTVTDTSGADEPNAVQVFFGTFCGVSDSVETPESGTLTIEGAYRGYGAGSFVNAKSTNTYVGCITGASDIGEPEYIGPSTFSGCTNLAITSLPESVKHIGDAAFRECTNLAITSLPSGVTYIGTYAFYQCENIWLTSLPSNVSSVGNYAFYGCLKIKDVVIPASVVSLGLRSLMCYIYEEATLGYTKCATNVRMLGATPPTMAEEAETYNDSGALGRAIYYEGTITVPRGLGDVYKTADVWDHYASKIVEAS